MVMTLLPHFMTLLSSLSSYYWCMLVNLMSIILIWHFYWDWPKSQNNCRSQAGWVLREGERKEEREASVLLTAGRRKLVELWRESWRIIVHAAGLPAGLLAQAKLLVIDWLVHPSVHHVLPIMSQTMCARNSCHRDFYMRLVNQRVMFSNSRHHDFYTGMQVGTQWCFMSQLNNYDGMSF